MKFPVIILCAALSGMLAAGAADSSPERSNRLPQEKERIQHLLKAAENLKAAGMEREANQLREQAERALQDLERRVREAEQQQLRDREGGQGADRDGRERPASEKPSRPQGDRSGAQVEELRAIVRQLAERVERLEAIIREMHQQQPHE